MQSNADGDATGKLRTKRRCRFLSVLILGFVRFCGRKTADVIGSARSARPHLLLAAHEVVAQVPGKTRLFQVRLGRILYLLLAHLAIRLPFVRRRHG
ncbi:MAG: hypothetical protein AAAB14_04425, partial [Ensifer adhaerens]